MKCAFFILVAITLGFASLKVALAAPRGETGHFAKKAARTLTMATGAIEKIDLTKGEVTLAGTVYQIQGAKIFTGGRMDEKGFVGTQG